MKLFLSLAFILFAFSCSKFSKQESDQTLIQDTDLTIVKNPEFLGQFLSFREIQNKAVLIGNKIDLLDKNLEKIEDISNLSGQIVKVIGVSDSLFNSSEDICDSFWYVKIKLPNKEGIINGRQVFKIFEPEQGTSLLIEGHNFEILRTEFFGMGVAYDGELMGCPVDQPILIRDEINEFFGLVKVIQNEVYKEVFYNHTFPYFELRSDDGHYDKIDSISFNGPNINIKVHRNFQEGENDYQVLIKRDELKYTAEYLIYGEVQYE